MINLFTSRSGFVRGVAVEALERNKYGLCWRHLAKCDDSSGARLGAFSTAWAIAPLSLLRELRRLRPCLWLLVLLLGGVGLADAYGESRGAVGAGLGGAGLAAIQSGESPYYNPAALPHIAGFHFSSYYEGTSFPDLPSGHAWSVMILDNTEGVLVPGAFSYTQSRLSDYEVKEFSVNMGQFLARRWSVGLGFIHQVAQHQVNDQSWRWNELNIGLMYVPWPILGFGAMARHLLEEEKLPELLDKKTTFELGAHFLYAEFIRMRADILWEQGKDFFKEGTTKVGLETFFLPDWAFRIGSLWRRDAKQHFFTTGLGWKGPRLSFDYALQTETSGVGGVRHVVDIYLPF